MQILLPALPAYLGGFLVALVLALAGRAARWRWLGGLAAGAGVLAGWWWVFGSFPASPRQLPERLPMLALVVLAWAALGLGWRRAPKLPMAVLGAVGAGWWMSGAPLIWPDLVQAGWVLMAIASHAVLALRAGRVSAVLAAAALLGGLLLAGLPGPAPVLAAVLLAATLGAAALPWRGALAALPVATALTALAAVPVLARGDAADWAVSALPLLVIWGAEAARQARRFRTGGRGA